MYYKSKVFTFTIGQIGKMIRMVNYTFKSQFVLIFQILKMFVRIPNI